MATTKAGALPVAASVHFADELPGPLPTLRVALSPHVEVPARGLPPHPPGAEPIGDEVPAAQAQETRGGGDLVGELLPVEDPVVDVALAGLELGGPHRVVEDQGVDHEVRLVEQCRLEPLEELREVESAPSAVADLEPAGLLVVQDSLQHPGGGVGLLHPLALGEGVPDHRDPVDPVGLRLRRHVTESEVVVAEAHRPGMPAGDGLEAMRGDGEVAVVGLGFAQVDVEVPARVRGVAVQQPRPFGVHDAAGGEVPLGSEAHGPKGHLRQDEDDENRPCRQGEVGHPLSPASAHAGLPHQGRDRRDAGDLVVGSERPSQGGAAEGRVVNEIVDQSAARLAGAP